MSDPRDNPGFLPFDADAADAPPSDAVLGGAPAPIAYQGQAFTRDQFRAYVDALAFPDPPAWLVLHHTAIPSTSWAPYGSGMVWDAGEASLSEAQRVAKRLRQLRSIFDYYARKDWSAGPHLWVDDLRIYVGTPLTVEGIHAAGGNWATVNGRRRYSLGLEVVGYHAHLPWPAAVAQNVAWAVAVLQRRLQAFRLASGRGPGFVSEHRHYQKPNCPGAAVQATQYLPLFRAAAAELEPPAIGFTADSAIIGPRLLPDAHVIAAFARLCARRGSPYAAEPARPLETVIGPAYAAHCAALGVRLVLALAQCAHETGWLTSALSQRRDRDGRPLRNPAGIGVFEAKDQATAHHRPGTVWDADVGGYRPCVGFADWARDAIPAHVGRLVAYATHPGQRTPAQRAWVSAALAYRGLPLNMHGSAPTLKQLGRQHNPTGQGWASPGTDYGAKVAAAANAILAEATNGPQGAS